MKELGLAQRHALQGGSAGSAQQQRREGEEEGRDGTTRHVWEWPRGTAHAFALATRTTKPNDGVHRAQAPALCG